jgi:hypothetical protein
MSDLEQRRRTVRVLELLDESFRAHQRGDDSECGRLIDEACDVDAFAVSGIQGGVRIGEIPNPDTHLFEWAAYVQAARDELARAEEGSGG